MRRRARGAETTRAGPGPAGRCSGDGPGAQVLVYPKGKTAAAGERGVGVIAGCCDCIMQ